MLMAIFAAAHFMEGTREDKNQLGGYFHKFMYMYLAQSADFDYVPKDVYKHEPAVVNARNARRRGIA